MKPEWFAGRLRELRRASGLTQRQLADAAGLTYGCIAGLEQEAVGPTWATVLALCQALGVDPLAFAQEPAQADKNSTGRPRKARSPASKSAKSKKRRISSEDHTAPKPKRQKETAWIDFYPDYTRLHPFLVSKSGNWCSPK